jgi:hypothetical protein
MRYKFYLDDNKFTDPETLQRMKKACETLLSIKSIPPKEDLGIEDGPLFALHMEKIRQEIIAYGESLGVSLADRLITNENIYFLPIEMYDKHFDPKEEGNQSMNEIAIRGEFETSHTSHICRHEQIHAAIIREMFISLDKDGRCFAEELSFGYSSGSEREHMRYFTEALIEIMNMEIGAQAKKERPEIGYVYNVIFVYELAADMAKKLNADPDKKKRLAIRPNSLDSLNMKDVIRYLIAGMLENDRMRLGVISDLYDRFDQEGKKTFDALQALSQMETGQEEVASLAEQFGLKETAEKISKLDS